MRDHRRDRDSTPVVVHEERRTDYVYVEPVESTGPSQPFSGFTGPTWMFEAGAVGHRFRGPAFAESGSVETLDGTMATYGVDSGTPAAGDTGAAGLQLRFAMPTSENTYAGVEAVFGGLTRSPIRLMSDAADNLHFSSKALIETNAVVGARARQGFAELDAELAGGVRFVTVNIQSRGAGEDDPYESEYKADMIVEARLRGLLWITPHMFFGAQAGAGVLDRGDVNVGLTIGFASRGYGQMR